MTNIPQAAVIMAAGKGTRMRSKTTKILHKIAGLSIIEEWECAAYAGKRFNYSGSNIIDIVGWHGENSEGHTHPVALKQSNAWGLFDCSGNVWEWVYDAWDSKAYISRKDGLVHPIVEHINDEHPHERAARGGSWFGESDNCRVSYRASFEVTYRVGNLGLRLAQGALEDSDMREDVDTSSVSSIQPQGQSEDSKKSENSE